MYKWYKRKCDIIVLPEGKGSFFGGKQEEKEAPLRQFDSK